jgi:U3 small nucleolar RNA-associated protein 20
LSDITKPLPEVSLSTVKEKDEFYNYNLTYDSFIIIGKKINVETELEMIIEKLEFLMKNVTDVSVIERFKGVFDNFERGIKNNKSVAEPFIGQFITQKIEDKASLRREFKVTEDGISILGATRVYVDQMKETFEVAEEPGRTGAISLNDTRRQELIAKSKNRNDNMLIHFYLKIFESFLAKKVIKNETLLDSFLPTLSRLLGGQQKEVALDSLRILIVLHNFKLSSYDEKEIIENLFEFMLNTGVDSKSEVWDTIFYAIKFFIDHDAQFTELQLKVLFDILKVEIIGTEFREQPFSLVAYLVSKGIVVPQVYDIAMKLRTIIMISETNIRNYSIQILTNFFLKYPMTPAVLQDHLNYLFKNVINEKLPMDSKLNVIAMINTIITKFPTEFLNEKIEFILFPLIISLSDSEENSKQQNQLENTLFELFKRISSKEFEKVLNLVLKWFVDPKMKLVATHVLSIISKLSNGEKLLLILEDLFEELKTQMEPQQSDFEELIYSPRFILIYKSLLVLKNLMEFKKLNTKKMDQIFDFLLKFIVYPSLDIRRTGLEMLTMYFKNLKNFEKKNESVLMELCLLLVENLSSRNLEENIANSVTKLLVHLLAHVNDEKNLQEIFRECEVTSLFVEEDYNLSNVLLRRKSMLTLYIALLHQSKEKMVPYLSHIFAFLYDLIENKKTIIDLPLKKYVGQISEAMKQILGFQLFNDEFLKISQIKFNENEQRKAEYAQEAILDPELYAKKKLIKNKEKSEKRKRERLAGGVESKKKKFKKK